MLRIGLAAAAGLAGWAARLLFVAGIAACLVGLYISLFASLGRRDAGHDWLLGLEIIGGGFTGSVIGFAGAFAPWVAWRVGRPKYSENRPIWYWGCYPVFLATAVGLLCLGCALRFIGDWERSNVTVAATVSDCSTQDSDSGTSYSCTYDWDWKGVHHTQGRSANGQYPDGQQVNVWIDPVTGGADDHSLTPIVFAFLGAGIIGLFDLAVYAAVLAELLDRRRTSFRPWLNDLAWWRTLPKPEPEPEPEPAPQPTPLAEPVIEDAIPVDGVVSGWVEDARPPGY